MIDLASERKRLFGLAYRMTGSAADADDVVQETFVRALGTEGGAPSPSWLVTVALNVARDRLRKRKRERYVGPWLPAPIDVDAALEPPSPDDRGTEGRYAMLESVSFAFLLALEALTPLQRAVLLLRDVFDYSARETAEVVGSTEGAVKVQLLRARRKMSGYDKRLVPKNESDTQAALVRFLGALRDGDAATVESLLADDAVLSTDGGGEFLAAGVVVTGRARIAKALLGITRGAPPLLGFELRRLNGTPSVVGLQDGHGRIARDFVMACELDGAGKIRAFYTILATRKLTGPGARLA